MWVLLLHPLTLLYDGALYYNAMQFTLCTAVVVRCVDVPLSLSRNLSDQDFQQVAYSLFVEGRRHSRYGSKHSYNWSDI